MKIKYESCYSCLVFACGFERKSTLCKICDGDDMFIPITKQDIAELKVNYSGNLDLITGGACGKAV